MIRYQKLHGVNVGAASALPAVPISPEGQAMGAVPGWKLFLDPAHMVNGAPRNRALPNNVTSLVFGEMALSEFDNGSPAFQFNETVGIQPNLPIHNSAWTMFSVVKMADVEIAGLPSEMAISLELGEEPELCVRHGFNVYQTAMTFYEGPTISSRARYNYPQGEGNFRAQTLLAMWTFSTRDGIRLYLNGKEVDHKEDKRLFDRGYGAGEWIMFRGFRGLAGMTGMLDIDLGWAEHTGHRRAIEKFLMNKYEISE